MVCHAMEAFHPVVSLSPLSKMRVLLEINAFSDPVHCSFLAAEDFIYSYPYVPQPTLPPTIDVIRSGTCWRYLVDSLL